MIDIALQVAWTDATTQITVDEAYVRVVDIHVDAIAQTIDLTVGLYASAAAQAAGAKPFAPLFHAWPLYASFLGESVDVRAAAYGYIKTLPGFADATDV